MAVTDEREAPFSLFRHIVVGGKGLSAAELQMVLAHERLHAEQGHSWDRLAVRLAGCLLWFDPFVWLYGREVAEVHEFLADEAVLQQRGEDCVKDYLRLLYCQATGVRFGGLVNNLHVSSIKNRIAMMKQSESRSGWARALAALPVAAVLLLANCKNQEPSPQQAAIPDGTYEVSPFINTYQGGRLVGREFMGAMLPIDEVGEHAVFADSAEAVRFQVKLQGEGKTARMVAMLNLGDSTAEHWYEVAWDEDRWWNDEDTGIFQLAEYPGGFEALADYMAKGILYPARAKAEGVQGRVYVQFVVEADGTVGDATVKRGIGAGCDEVALQVVKAMPRWVPAQFKGKPVRSKFTIPVNFTLK